MMLSKTVRARVRMRVINQSDQSAGNECGAYTVLGLGENALGRVTFLNDVIFVTIIT